jgi:hypothetical protein
MKIIPWMVGEHRLFKNLMLMFPDGLVPNFQ